MKKCLKNNVIDGGEGGIRTSFVGLYRYVYACTINSLRQSYLYRSVYLGIRMGTKWGQIPFALLLTILLTGCNQHSQPYLSTVSDFTHENDLRAVFPDKRTLPQVTREHFENIKLEAELSPGKIVMLKVWMKNGFVYNYEFESLDCPGINEPCVSIEQLAGMN